MNAAGSGSADRGNVHTRNGCPHRFVDVTATSSTMAKAQSAPDGSKITLYPETTTHFRARCAACGLAVAGGEADLRRWAPWAAAALDEIRAHGFDE